VSPGGSRRSMWHWSPGCERRPNLLEMPSQGGRRDTCTPSGRNALPKDTPALRARALSAQNRTPAPAAHCRCGAGGCWVGTMRPAGRSPRRAAPLGRRPERGATPAPNRTPAPAAHCTPALAGGARGCGAGGCGGRPPTPPPAVARIQLIIGTRRGGEVDLRRQGAAALPPASLEPLAPSPLFDQRARRGVACGEGVGG